MKQLLNLEEWGIFLLCIFLFSRLPFAWWWFPALLLLPDVGMIGYLFGPKWGAWTYNLLHHRTVAAVVAVCAFWLNDDRLKLTALILFAHISMDRVMGYGLKHETGFADTHLGTLPMPKKSKGATFAWLLVALMLPFGASAQVTDTLTVAQCRAWAVQNSPLQAKKLYAETITALQLRSIESNNLPRVSVGGQATYQSEVFGLPIESPLFKVPTVPKDQYRLSVDVAQRLYDGHSDRFQQQQRQLERELASAQVDLDVFSLREVVTDLFFKALLLQSSEAVLAASLSDLETRRRQAEAAMKEGVALRTTVDQVQIQILKTEQQIALAQADKKTVLAILGHWVGRPLSDRYWLATPAAQPSSDVVLRPEYRFFDLQNRQLQLGKDALKLRTQPRVEAFAQGGLGRPNPFNAFETGFNPFGIVGIRAQWTPIHWGNRQREAQIFEVQSQQIAAQRLAFEQRLQSGTLKDRLDQEKYAAQLAADDKIIALQEDIVKRADAQVKNGVMTATDYLTQLNLLTQAKLAKKTHEIQALQSLELMRAKQ